MLTYRQVVLATELSLENLYTLFSTVVIIYFQSYYWRINELKCLVTVDLLVFIQ